MADSRFRTGTGENSAQAVSTGSLASSSASCNPAKQRTLVIRHARLTVREPLMKKPDPILQFARKFIVPGESCRTEQAR